MQSRSVLLASLLGSILPLIIASLVMWRLLFTPGTIFHGDFEIIFDARSMLKEFNYAWVPEQSSSWNPNAAPWFLLLAFLSLFGFSTELTIKLWVLVSYVLSSAFIYLTLLLLLPSRNKFLCYFASSIGLVVYMLNQTVISELIVPHMLLSYSALPFTVALSIRIIQQGSLRRVVKYLLGFALSSPFLSIYSPALVLFVIFNLSHIVYRFIKYRTTFVRHDLSRISILLFAYIISNSYWLLPLLSMAIYAPAAVISAYTQSSFSLQELYTGWNAQHGWNTVNVIGLIGGFGWPYNQEPPNAVSSALSLFLPMVAFSILFFFKRLCRETRKYVILHSLTFVSVMLFADRDEPFISIVATLSQLIWYSNMPLRGPLWTMIKQPSLFTPLIPYLYSFLVASLVLVLFSESSSRSFINALNPPSNAYLKPKNIGKKVGKASLVLGILALSIVASWPFSGDVYGRFRPVQIPQEYYQLNAYFEKQGGFYRAWWLPIDYGFWYYSWSGYYPHSHPFYTTEPWVLWKSDITSYLYLYGILENGARNVGTVLASLGTGYVILHTDIYPQTQLGFQDELTRALEALKGQKDLSLVAQDPYLSLFKVNESTQYVPAGSLALVFGGYKTILALSDLGQENLKNYEFVFADQLNGNLTLDLLKSSDVIVFGSHTDIGELPLQLFTNQFVYPPSSSEWVSVSNSNFYWSYLNRLGLEKGMFIDWSGDIAYGDVLTITSQENATLQIPISIPRDGSYELWFRVLKSPLGGSMSVRLEGLGAWNINTNASDAYLGWVNIANLQLNKGQYALSVNNLQGLNGINVVLVESEANLQKYRSIVFSILSDKTIVMINKEFYKVLGKVDQQAWPEEAINGVKPMGLQWVAGKFYVAQLFIPQQTSISSVELWLARYNATADLEVDLVPVVNGIPNLNQVLARADISPRAVTYVASSPITIKLKYDGLVVGNPYALVIRQKGDGGTGKDDAYFVYYALGIDAYQNGYILSSNDGGKTWNKDFGSQDLLFKTYYPAYYPTDNLREAEISNSTVYVWNQSSNEFKKITSFPSVKSGVQIISFDMPYPGKYVVTVNASKPFVLAISESYNPLWQININDAIHLPVLSTMNGYYVNETGLLTITVEYSQNQSFKIGILLSVTSILAVIVLVTASRSRK